MPTYSTRIAISALNALAELNINSDKIHVLEVDLSDLEGKENTWNRERAQRNAAKALIKENDVCYISDCDEIIDPNFIYYYASVAKKYPSTPENIKTLAEKVMKGGQGNWGEIWAH